MLVHENAVYVVESKREQETARLVQLDLETGESDRVISLAGAFSSRPTLARHGNALVVLQRGHLETFDLESGERLWEAAYPAWVGGWPRLAVTETSVVLQRGRGLEVIDLATGEPHDTGPDETAGSCRPCRRLAAGGRGDRLAAGPQSSIMISTNCAGSVQNSRHMRK